MGEEDFVTTSQSFELVLRRDCMLRESFAGFLKSLVASLEEAGCRSICHIKGDLEAADFETCSFSTTSLSGQPRYVGGDCRGPHRLKLRINSIVEAVEADTVRSLVSQGLGEYFDFCDYELGSPEQAEADPRAVSCELRFIACPAVLGELADDATAGINCVELEAQLHISPERLREALRAAVAEADEPGAVIVLGYGLCGNAVLGLKTAHATLVAPRVDDCFALLLGSNEAYSAEAEKEHGTYYVAKAYLEECDTIFSEHEKMVEKYGRERAERMMRLLLAHYARIVLIDTGRYDLAPCRARIAAFADTFGLPMEDVPGTTRVLDALLAGEWGDDFVVAPPGHELTLADFRPELFSRRRREAV